MQARFDPRRRCVIRVDRQFVGCAVRPCGHFLNHSFASPNDAEAAGRDTVRDDGRERRPETRQSRRAWRAAYPFAALFIFTLLPL
ncbi:hypothetical protein WL76_19200 [Burkholderia ubonensis]|nr:hypothetical protein WL76_19200 [Burkholderia ubonensis]